MAGFLSLLFFGTVLGNSLYESVQSDIGSQIARKNAKTKGEIYYCDGAHSYRATETNELVYVVKDRDGAEIIKGQKTGRIYKEVKSNTEIREAKLKEAIQYCKDNNIKYLPWYFPVNIPRDNPFCTGIEIDTGKKYIIKGKHIDNQYIMLYLEDNPHRFHCEYGSFKEYDAVHDGTAEMHKNDYWSALEYVHRSDLNEHNTKYFTRCYIISKEEKEERLKIVERYPFDPYKIYC